ncbi:uncharacterized protein K02A2.6-like [Aedes albopictus]|uniref:Reverse transcriptase domain-containing protein n=1 Tax=Aedes albopictus TaxID=7160 RepID=A0ABM2A5E1_AEDAL
MCKTPSGASVQRARVERRALRFRGNEAATARTANNVPLRIVGIDLQDFCHVSEKKVDCKKQLKPLLLKHAEVFEGELGCFKHGKVHLSLKEEAVSRFCKPRKVPFAFKEKVEAELDQLEESGIISKAPSSEAEWGTPLVPVLKKDSSIRLCADYWITVNPFLVDNRHPFPVIDEIFAALQGVKYFSKLDLKNAYYQQEVDADTRHLLTWSTHRGVYLMNRLPFGTKTACAIFQATLEKVLQGCRGTVSYLDDVMVSGRTVEEHLENLNANATQGSGICTEHAEV